MRPRRGRVYPCPRTARHGRTAVAARLTRCHTERVRRVPALFRVPGAVPALVACTLFVVYCCVPETSHLPWVALLVAAVAALEFGGHRLMPWWSTCAAALVMWGSWQGGQYRASAMAGAAFAWWPWVLVWVVHATARGAHGRASVRACAVAAGVGLVAAVAVARTGGLARTLWPALLSIGLAVLASVPALVLGLAVEHHVRHRHHDLHHAHNPGRAHAPGGAGGGGGAAGVAPSEVERAGG